MKIILIITTTFLVLHLKANEMEDANTKCVAELGLDPAVHGTLIKFRRVTLNHDQKCLMRCVFKMVGYVTGSNKLKDGYIEAKLPGSTQEQVDECYGKLTTECEGFYDMIMCFAKLEQKKK